MEKIYTGFDTKTESRVKCVSLHSKCYWILVSFHNGLIRLYDYVYEILLEEFRGHEGPVRAVSFHKTLSIFVSGSDDHIIKVWDWRQKRCLFDLKGHNDYVRTTFFHDENPWIVSASDDQTVRIWNWQSRSCIAVLTGHNHYVMCAQFHPKQDLVVSCSLDQTARVWNISGLKNSNAIINSPSNDSFHGNSSQGILDSIIGIDISVKFILTGHENSVNWVEFHPTQPLILTTSDDKTVRLWRLSGSQAWETDIFRGHTGNVTCAVFDRTNDYIISGSEDKSIRAWNFKKKSSLDNVKREVSRFWTMTAHPTLEIYAAGHDNGFFMFKLNKLRPIFYCLEKAFVYIDKRSVIIYGYEHNEKNIVYTLPSNLKNNLGPCSCLSFNGVERALLLSFHGPKPTHYIYSFKNHDFNANGIPDAGDIHRGPGTHGFFISRSKFAVLDKSSSPQIVIKNLSNIVIHRINLAFDNVVSIHYYSNKNILLVTKDLLVMYDLDTLAVSMIFNIKNVLLVYPSPDSSKIALVTIQKIFIIDANNFKIKCILSNECGVRSCVWYNNDILVFNDPYHIKYLLSNGDTGILISLTYNVCLVRIIENKLFYISSLMEVSTINLNFTECIFKLNVSMGNKDIVQKIITSTNLVGQSIIGYLREKGYSDIPLGFIKDPKSKLDMSISCKNFDLALEAAMKLNDPDSWELLGQEALKNGNVEIAELSFQKNKNLDSLNKIYLITGNTEKLFKMISIHLSVNDYTSAYLNSILTRSTNTEVDVLSKCKKPFFSYLTAISVGDEHLAQNILKNSGFSGVPNLGKLNEQRRGEQILIGFPSSAINEHSENSVKEDVLEHVDEIGDSPISNDVFPVADEDLPVVNECTPVTKDYVHNIIKDELIVDDDSRDLNIGTEVSDSLIYDVSKNDNINDFKVCGYNIDDIDTENKWEFDLDRRNPNTVNDDASPITNSKNDIDLTSTNENCVENEEMRIYNFSDLNSLIISKLKSEKNVVNTEKVSYYIGLLSPNFVPISVPPNSIEQSFRSKNLFEPIMNKATEYLSSAKILFGKGSFVDSLDKFRETLVSLAPISAIFNDDIEISTLISEASKYILGICIELYRKRNSRKLTPERNLELAAYFTYCATGLEHLQLTLRSALSVAKSMHDSKYIVFFAEKLLETNPSPDLVKRINSLLEDVKNNSNDVHENISFNIYGPNDICSKKFTLIENPNYALMCNYCHSIYDIDVGSELCNICQIAQIQQAFC